MTNTTPAEVHFRAHVHHRNHHALVAVSALDGSGIGAARYIRHESDHDSADLEVSVDEAWQGRGVGTELLRRLMDRARDDGVRRMVLVLPEVTRQSALAG